MLIFCILVRATLEFDICVYFIFSDPWTCRVYCTGAQLLMTIHLCIGMKLVRLVQANISIFDISGRDGKEDGILVVS